MKFEKLRLPSNALNLKHQMFFENVRSDKYRYLCKSLFCKSTEVHQQIIVLYYCPSPALTDVNNIIRRWGGKQADKTVNLFVSHITHCLVFVLLFVPFSFSSLLQSNDHCHYL